MTKEAQETRKANLVPLFKPLAPQAVLPSLPVPCRHTVSIDLVAPAFRAKQLAEIEAEKRRQEKEACREQKRRLREQRAARRATFSVD